MRLKAIFRATDGFSAGTVVWVTHIERCNHHSCKTSCNRYSYIIDEDPLGKNTKRCGWAIDLNIDSLDYILFHENI